MSKYLVITRKSSSKGVVFTDDFNTLDEAFDYVEEQRADDMKHGEADEYEYIIRKQDN